MKKKMFTVKDSDRKLCRECQNFIAKHRQWNESKVPDVALVDHAECRKCRMTYTVYKGMVFPVPMATPEEEKEMNAQCGLL